jgi:ABC-type multidrug transport system fused ATPase/permease subunit
VFVPVVNPPDLHVDLTKTEGDNLSHFMAYPKKYCGWMIGGLFWLSGSMVAQFLIPWLVGVAIDSFKEKSMETMNKWCLIMAVAVVGSSICTLLRIRWFLEVACRVSWMIKYDLFNSLIHKDITFYDNNKTGELLSRMDSDTEIIQGALSF